MRYILKDQKRPLKICIFGPESTGKSTLAEKLAAHYEAPFAAEFAKELIFAQDGDISLDDIPRIARGQIAQENTAAKLADKVLFCDTDLITTTIWSDRLFGSCPQWVRDAADVQDFDFYLLMDIDTPWVADLHRYLPLERRSFFERCQQELDKRGLKYVKLSGTWEDKFEKACLEVNKLLSKYTYNQDRKKGAA